MLALGADSAGDPPDGRVIEEKRLDEGLEDADEVVVAADMGELVGEDGFELRGGETGEAADGDRTTGRSHPMTVGTWTSAEWSRRTGRETPMR